MPVVFGLAAFLLLAGAGCSTGVSTTIPSPPIVGAHVLTLDDTGNQWLEGNIDEISGTTYTVKLSNSGKIVSRTLNGMAPYPTGSVNVKVGDTVVGAWTTNTYYKGVVTAVANGLATVKWDDGSAPSGVELTALAKTYK